MEALLIDTEKFNKVNALSCCISGKDTPYGDAAVLVDAGNGEIRGFTAEEEQAFTEWLNSIIQEQGETLALIHKEHDNRKPVHEIQYLPFE